jgi:hypothetical protein
MRIQIFLSHSYATQTGLKSEENFEKREFISMKTSLMLTQMFQLKYPIRMLILYVMILSVS